MLSRHRDHPPPPPFFYPKYAGHWNRFWMSALILLSLLRFAITWTLRSSSTIHLQNWMFVSGAQYLQIIPHCPISHLSLLCGKWTFMYDNRLQVAYSPLVQLFSIPFLAYPCSALFVRFSYRFRCLYYSTVSALRSGHHITGYSYMFHSKGIEMCETWI